MKRKEGKIEYQSLNITNLLRGKIGNLVNKKSSKIFTVENIEGYKLIKDLTPSYSKESKKNRVGIYQNKNGKRVVIKRVNYLSENLDSTYLRNEAFTIKTLTDAKTKIKIFPEFVDFIQGKNYIAMATKFFEGRNLKDMDKKIRAEVIIGYVFSLQELSKTLEKNSFYSLPIRQPFYYLLSFPLSLLKVILKDRGNTTKYLNYSLSFYNNYFQVLFKKIPLGFCHRDLFPDNILYSQKNKTAIIIDWESSIVSDALYDLSQVAMIYFEDIGKEKLLEVLREKLNDNFERRRFIGLSIFNSLQVMSFTPTNHPVFKRNQRFLNILTNELSPKILYKKSPFEMVHLFTLDLISIFYKITGLSKYSKNKKIVLCYHSVGNSGWSFSTRVKNFKNQLQLLKNKYTLVSLPNLLKNKNGGITLTFDDGYVDVFQNALPILEENKVPATLFVLSTPKNSNRKELDNDLEIMDYKRVKTLFKKGWEIGSHTRTHSNLGKLTGKKLEDEIIKSKKELEKNLNFPIRFFAYPKGIYSQKIAEITEKAEYNFAFTTDCKEIPYKISKPMLLGRVSIEGELTISQFEALLSPFGLFTTKIFVKLLVIKARITNLI